MRGGAGSLPPSETILTETVTTTPEKKNHPSIFKKGQIIFRNGQIIFISGPFHPLSSKLHFFDFRCDAPTGAM
ncbi:MAG: hypothetical protein IKR18_01430 [Bacteroidaceae bacterium]|nr:hypothetical protein [Bacteroidaceae bacterium]